MRASPLNPEGTLVTRPAPSPARQRLAISLVFFCNGAGFASWVSRIPAVREQLGLSEGELGTALLAMAAGALMSFPLAGRAIGPFGARKVTAAAAALFFVMLPQPMWVGLMASLLIVLFVLGAGNGAMDVAMNAVAVEVEAACGKPIMSSLHGLWSVGGLTGAALGGAAAHAGLSPGVHLSLAAGLLGGMAWLALRQLPGPRPAATPPVAQTGAAVGQATPPDACQAEPAAAPRRGRLALPARPLLGLGALVFCGFLIEGAMADWSAVLLKDRLGTTAAVAALGYAAFSLTMTVMRLGGDPLAARWGAVPLLRLFNLAAAAGMTAALATGHVGGTLAAFALCGLGVALIVPTVFRAAARFDGTRPGSGIATMAAFGYSGFLLGPPLIGWLAQLTDLRLALGVVPLLAVGVVAMLPLLAAGERPQAAPAGAENFSGSRPTP